MSSEGHLFEFPLFGVQRFPIPTQLAAGILELEASFESAAIRGIRFGQVVAQAPGHQQRIESLRQHRVQHGGESSRQPGGGRSNNPFGPPRAQL